MPPLFEHPGFATDGSGHVVCQVAGWYPFWLWHYCQPASPFSVTALTSTYCNLVGTRRLYISCKEIWIPGQTYSYNGVGLPQTGACSSVQYCTAGERVQVSVGQLPQGSSGGSGGTDAEFYHKVAVTIGPLFYGPQY